MPRKDYDWTTASEVLLRRFHEMAGVETLEAVSAFASPPNIGWRRFVGRQHHILPFAIPTRIIVRTKDGLELWSANTGPTPGKKLSGHALTDFHVVTLESNTAQRHPFDRIALATTQLWVSSTYRAIVSDRGGALA